jgi:hypothetical protein
VILAARDDELFVDVDDGFYASYAANKNGKVG